MYQPSCNASLSFWLIVLAGITRLLGGLFPNVLGIHAYGLAIILWIAAYSIFHQGPDQRDDPLKRPDTSKQLSLKCQQPISCKTVGVHTSAKELEQLFSEDGKANGV